MAARAEVQVEIEGRTLRLSNLGKVFYPAAGFTKGQLIDYYLRVAPVLLPHLRGRPLTMKRYPDGVEGPFFYEKRCPAHRPSWVRTEPVWSEGNDEFIPFCVVDDVATLAWAANLADVELHTSMSLAQRIAHPTMMVFDLDPGPPAGVVECCDVALELRLLFDELGLQAFPKTSGSKGLQIYVPLNDPETTYEHTKGFAHAAARALEARHPDRILSRMSKALRAGKVFVDWSQNDVHKTTVCVYSLRARERPTVSTPLRWSEVAAAASERDGRALVFEADAVLRRVERDGDLFEPVLSLRQELPADAAQVARTAAPPGVPRRRRSPSTREASEVASRSGEAEDRSRPSQAKGAPREAEARGARPSAAAGRRRRKGAGGARGDG